MQKMWNSEKFFKMTTESDNCNWVKKKAAAAAQPEVPLAASSSHLHWSHTMATLSLLIQPIIRPACIFHKLRGFSALEVDLSPTPQDGFCGKSGDVSAITKICVLRGQTCLPTPGEYYWILSSKTQHMRRCCILSLILLVLKTSDSTWSFSFFAAQV